MPRQSFRRFGEDAAENDIIFSCSDSKVLWRMKVMSAASGILSGSFRHLGVDAELPPCFCSLTDKSTSNRDVKFVNPPRSIYPAWVSW